MGRLGDSSQRAGSLGLNGGGAATAPLNEWYSLRDINDGR